ncbi:hypothetical protein MMC20_004838 [Loxospora ochrophaea]|nr:hypothetical protein [Loxospora ochrophaea]
MDGAISPALDPILPSNSSNEITQDLNTLVPDQNFVLQAFAERSLEVEDVHKQDLFLTSSELQRGAITKKEFCDLVKCYAKFVGTLIPAAPIAGSNINPASAVGAAAELASAIEEVATKIPDRAEADLLSKRYLEGLEAA